MIESIAIGTAMIVATVMIQSIFVAVAVAVLGRTRALLARMHSVLRTTVTLTALTLWLLGGITVALWMWAILLMELGEFTTLYDAIYFSSVSATTLGFGDVILSRDWQLLSGFLGANGFVLFSLTTAFLFEAVRRVEEAGQES